MHPGSGELDALFVGSCHIGQTRSPLQCYWPQSSSSGRNPSQYKSPRLSRENEVDPIDIKFVSVFLWICGVIPSEEKYLGLLRTEGFRVWSSLGVTCINYAAGRKLSEVGGSLAKTAHLGSHGIPREPPCLDKRHSLNPGDIGTWNIQPPIKSKIRPT